MNRCPFLSLTALALLTAATPAAAQPRAHPLTDAMDLFCRGASGSVEDTRRLRTLMDGDESAGTIGPFSFDPFRLNVSNALRMADGTGLEVSIVRVPDSPSGGCVLQMNEQPRRSVDDRTITRAFDAWAGGSSPRFQRRARSIPQDGGGYMSSWARAVNGRDETVMVVTYPASVGEPAKAMVLYAVR